MHALDTMRALASKAEVIHLSQGDVLFRTGETGTCMYGMLEGSVRLTWIDSAGHEGHEDIPCLLYTSPSPRDKRQSRMPSSA